MARGVWERAESVRKVRPILDRAELGFGERIVVAHAGPGVTRVDAEVREQVGDERAAHGRAAVGVECELVRPDALLAARRVDQAPGQMGVLVRGDHPAHHVAAEEVKDHVKREVHVGDRAFELGDVPRPDLIRRRRHELGFGVGRVPGLIAPLPDFACLGEHAIHGAHRPQVGLFLEQGRVDFRRRLIHEPFAVQHVEDRLPFRWDERARRGRAAQSRFDRACRLPTPIERGARDADTLTKRRRLTRGRDGLDRDHQSISSPSRGFRGIPRISATFFWLFTDLSTAM